MINQKEIAIGDTIYTGHPNMDNEYYPVKVLDISPGAVSQSRLLVTIRDNRGVTRKLDASWFSKYKLN